MALVGLPGFFVATSLCAFGRSLFAVCRLHGMYFYSRASTRLRGLHDLKRSNIVMLELCRWMRGAPERAKTKAHNNLCKDSHVAALVKKIEIRGKPVSEQYMEGTMMKQNYTSKDGCSTDYSMFNTLEQTASRLQCNPVNCRTFYCIPSFARFSLHCPPVVPLVAATFSY